MLRRLTLVPRQTYWWAGEKGLLYCFLVSFVLLSKTACFAGNAIGTLTLIEGPVTVRKIGGQEVSVTPGDKLRVGDILETGEKSRAQVVLTDDSTIDLSSRTILRVNQYVFDFERNRRTTLIKVPAGKARFAVFRKRDNESTFKVEAGYAAIAAAVADFVAIISPRETTVAVTDGSVGVKNSSYLTVGQIRLGSNQTTIVKEKQMPSAPAVMRHEQRRTYNKDAHQF